MKKVLILGAGMVSKPMFEYLLNKKIQITVASNTPENSEKVIGNNPLGKSLYLDIVEDKDLMEKLISEHDLTVSLLPYAFHVDVAKLCIKHKKNMVTTSYVKPEMYELDQQAKDADIIILNELGVDPGIDHMSAMKVIDKLRADGSTLDAFFSSTGGLVAPEYDNNPWNYKFTWNPRNVVLAGQGTSMFIRNGRYKYIPYQRLFYRISHTSIDGVGEFEIYPNRDSLKYRETYGLEDIPTIFRGTMRRKGYARAWNVFIQLGATDDSYVIEDSANMTFRQFINTFLAYEEHTPLEKKIRSHFKVLIDDDVYRKLEWLDIFKDIKIPLERATPAQILQYILERKWQLEEGDKDMIAMQHRFEFTTKNNEKRKIVSSLIVMGETKEKTAMAITVGTPLAIATKMVANGELSIHGVQVPVIPEMYNPILDELEELGIKFNEVESGN